MTVEKYELSKLLLFFINSGILRISNKGGGEGAKNTCSILHNDLENQI